VYTCLNRLNGVFERIRRGSTSVFETLEGNVCHTYVRGYLRREVGLVFRHTAHRVTEVKRIEFVLFNTCVIECRKRGISKKLRQSRLVDAEISHSDPHDGCSCHILPYVELA